MAKKIIEWSIHHRRETDSTNIDARSGRHGDVFTADFQTAGRGRLDHRWLSPPGENLMMSVVLDVGGLSPEEVATFPLVVGLAVAEGADRFLHRDGELLIKWPNDVLCGGRKLAGTLCERQGDSVVAGIGVNVNQTSFPDEISDRATSIALLLGKKLSADDVRDAVLSALGGLYAAWMEKGFAAIHPEIARIDALNGEFVSIAQTDSDGDPVSGICGGIAPDGSLLVGGLRIYAGEAHVLRRQPRGTPRKMV